MNLFCEKISNQFHISYIITTLLNYAETLQIALIKLIRFFVRA